MKKPALLIFVTFLVLVLLFCAYLVLIPQGNVVQRENSLQPATRPSMGETAGGLGVGENAWVKQFDDRTGALASQFRGDRYDRMPDGSVRVIHPQTEFFLADGQILRITGDTGTMVIPESLHPGKDNVFSGPSRPPTRGDMHNVHIQLFPDDTAGAAPTLTCVMDNATFDNETFRIFTQETVIDGQKVAADQVPVTLRGVDYDFDGRGLTIRLNQRDRRLEYLEVTHGQRLVVKNPSALSDTGLPGGAGGAKPAGNGGSPGAMASPLPDMFASAGPVTVPTAGQRTARIGRANGATATTSAATQEGRSSSVYRASFQHDVRVLQAEQELASGDELQIDFLFKQDTGDETTTRPTTRMSSRRRARSQPASTGATSPAASVAAVPATSPATRPAQQPVTIYWTGKLTLTPVASSEELPRPNDSIVRIAGSPLHVQQGPGSITGSALIYRTGSQHLSLRGTEQFPLVLRDGKGATVNGTSIDYLQQEHFAVLDGRGRATKVLPANDPGQQPKTLAAEWTRSATLYFVGEGNEPLRIESAKLDGQVSVNHPQLHLSSDDLRLAFDTTPTTKPSAATAPAGETAEAKSRDRSADAAPDFAASDLRHLDAQGHVVSTVIGSNGRPQSISTDRLQLDTASTPDGRIYPSKLIADGSVHAYDADQEMRAGHLTATLVPTKEQPSTRPSGAMASASAESPDSVPVELEHLTATHNVSVRTADGASAAADRLDVDVVNGQQQVRLLGNPARVASKENSVAGPYIEIVPGQQVYHVRGPGQMHLVQKEENAAPNARPRPVDISWTRAVDVDGKANLIDVQGGVKVLSQRDDGSRSSASGDEWILTLADNPHPTTRKSPSTRKATPLSGIAAQGDPMQDKVVQSITLKQGEGQVASVESVETGPAGDLLRQTDLQAKVINYDLPAKRLTVPVPGRMLFVSRQGSASPPADQTGQLGGSKGNTAFQWSQKMIYDESASNMTMTGDVVIAHEAGDNGQPFRLDADTVIADLVSTPSTRPADSSSPMPSQQDAVQLKHVRAEGAIRFSSKNTSLTASSVDYDPESGVLIARGQGRDPVRLYTADGVPVATAREVWFNTRTGQNLKMIDVQARSGKR